MKASASIKNINFAYVFQTFAALSLGIIYIFQWLTMITNSSLRTGTDFMAFYAVGRVAQEYGYAKTYDISLQQKIQEEVVGFPLIDEQVLLYNHLPFEIPIISLVVSENYIASFTIWVILMFVVYITSGYVFIKSIQQAKNNPSFLLGVILFFPFFQSLLLGQDTAILFLGVALWTVGMKQKKDWLIAIGLTLTSVRPHLCLAFTIPLLFRDLQLGWKFIISSSLLTIISILLIGSQGTLDFIRVLQISAGGTWHGMNENAMFNLIGFIARSLPFLEPNNIRIFGWIGYIGSIIFLIFIWRKKEKSIDWLISFSILVTLFFAPHLHYHDLSLLAIPLILLFKENKYGDKILLTVSLILLTFRPLHYILPYILYSSLAWQLRKKRN